MAMGRPSDGEKPPGGHAPDTTPSRVGDFGALARRRLAVERKADRTPRHALASSRRTRAAPGKPPSSRRRFEIDQVRAASTGLVVASMSWP